MLILPLHRADRLRLVTSRPMPKGSSLLAEDEVDRILGHPLQIQV